MLDDIVLNDISYSAQLGQRGPHNWIRVVCQAVPQTLYSGKQRDGAVAPKE